MNRASLSNGARPRGFDAGFSLVELMMVVVIIGVLAAVALPSYRTYVKRSRTSEVAPLLNRMWSGSVSYYMTDYADANGAVLARQFPGAVAPFEPACCSTEDQRCPANHSTYQDPIWMALNMNIPVPHSFRPGYLSAGLGSAAMFTAEARGDLDCDGVQSNFARSARIDSSGEVAGSGVPHVLMELE